MVRNISHLTVGSGIAQVLSIIGAFYIPRMLGAENYGTLNIVTSYIALFTVFSFTGFNEIITRECSRNLDQIQEIFNGFIGIKLIFSISALLIALTCLLFIDYEATTKFYIVFFSISLVVGQPLLTTINTIYQINEQLRYTAIFEVIRSIVTVSLSILAVTLGYGVLAILIIRLFGWGLTIIASYFTVKLRFFPIRFFSKINWNFKFIKQGLVFSTNIFLNALSGKIDLVMLSILTTPVNVGIYALAYNIVDKGLIVRRAIQNSLFPVYVKRNKVAPIAKKLLFTHTLAIVGVVSIIITALLLSSKLIIFIVGQEYQSSIDILNILAFYLMLNFTIIPYELMLQTTYNESKLIFPRVVSSVLNIGLNLMLFHFFGLIGIAFSTLVTYFVSNLIIFTTTMNGYRLGYIKN